MSLQNGQSGNSEWFLDSGASSHITGNAESASITRRTYLGRSHLGIHPRQPAPRIFLGARNTWSHRALTRSAHPTRLTSTADGPHLAHYQLARLSCVATWPAPAIPRGSSVNLVSGKWIYRHKLNPDGSLARYKARWVLRGFTQRPGVDFGETFSPVVKPATIRVVLSLAVSSSWDIRQLDVKNVFLQGHLDEVVYSQQPAGFIDIIHPNHVCRLNKSLYGLKQAPRAWFQRFTSYLARLGFVASKCDSSLFILQRGGEMAYLLLYVDDIILTASSPALLRHIIARLHHEFAMTDLGELHHFLGINVHRNDNGLFLSQQQYALEILDRASMTNCNPIATPVDTKAKLSATEGPPVADLSLYRSLAGALQYLTLTRPDLAYAVQQTCLFMHDPREPHFTLLKRILRYVRGTAHHGLLLRRSHNKQLVAYSDADWAGCPDTRKSHYGKRRHCRAAHCTAKPPKCTAKPLPCVHARQHMAGKKFDSNGDVATLPCGLLFSVRQVVAVRAPVPSDNPLPCGHAPARTAKVPPGTQSTMPG
ncbi:hypothetical protein QYE76_031390 [Lolium multiflorum]|uniref:Reverse transcriptase Ty1/copia-type domain-containing protein n=1 Tax=Lolium multiflorum TaxID=4521 RepID=A0AAD8QS31_LOLMU|nr:hypothetical protein QYE76_031390 [Lolium multiflorum]